MAEAILNNKPVKRAEKEYVKQVFDAFAADFDATLNGLEYQAPEYVAEAVRQVFKKDFLKPVRYLDLGCGTGLCARAVKPIIGWSEITGIDLSDKMLEEARSQREAMQRARLQKAREQREAKLKKEAELANLDGGLYVRKIEE